MRRESVRDFLRRRGSAPHVVEAGLPGLLKAWQRFVTSVERGYPLTLDDYLNDVDGRQILAEILAALPDAATPAQREHLAKADARLRAASRPGPCLWGDANAQAQGWTPKAQWWYFRHPVKPGPELAAELDGGPRRAPQAPRARPRAGSAGSRLDPPTGPEGSRHRPG